MRAFPRRAAYALLAALVAAGLAGCWDEAPIESLAFVSMVAFDGRPGHLTVIAEPIVPTDLPGGGGSSAGGKGHGFSLDEGEGDDAYTALRNAQLHASKRLSLGQLEVVLVTDRAVQSGALPGILDYFMRAEKTRAVPWLYIVPANHLASVMATQPRQASYPAQAVVYQSLQEQQLAEVFSTRVFRVYANLQGGGQDAAVPVLSSVGQHFTFDQTAVLRGDRLAGYLDATDGQSLALLLGTSGQVPVTLACGAAGLVSTETTGARVRLGATSAHGHLTGLRLRVDAGVRLTDISSCPELLHQKQGTTALLDPVAHTMVGQFERVVAHLQALDSDTLGFAAYLHAYRPDLWYPVAARWRAVYPRTPVVVEVHLEPDSTGLLTG